MGIWCYLTCLLRNLYAGQEVTVTIRHGKMDQFKIEKGVCQGGILSPCLSNLHEECIMQKAGLGEAQAGIKIVGRNINNLRYHPYDTTRWHHTYGRKWKGTKEPLDESERIEWKSWLKTQHSKNEDHGIWSHHFMANRWGNNGNSERLYFLGLQNHCGQWLQMKKRCDKPRQRMKKQRHHFPNKGLYNQSYNFPLVHVWMWEMNHKDGFVLKNW